MLVRNIEPDDFDKIRQIHEKFYKDEFDLPDFCQNFICNFVIENDGTIVTVGGLRTIAEIIYVTNKDLSVRLRRRGMIEGLNASRFFARNLGYDQLHVFVQDKDYERQLLNRGFSVCKGDALVTGV